MINEVLNLPRSANEFSLMIEGMKTEERTYIETLIEFCDDNSCDVEDVVQLINPSLKDKLEIEAKQAKMFKDNSINVLPI